MPLYHQSLRQILPSLVGDRRRIAEIYSSVLEVMNYAHEQGVIHRDLKPENILLNDDEDLVVSDFGLGLDFDAGTTRLTYTGAQLGTYGYMAPEQFQDAKRTDNRTDIFSLGRILCELFTGVHPAAGYGPAGLPVGIAKIVERCTKIEPKDRFQAVEDLLSAFTIMEKSQRAASAPEELHKLLGDLITQGFATGEQTEEMAKLIAQSQEDAMLLHEFAIKVPGRAFEALHQGSPEVARLLVQQFTNISNSQSWSFEYTDQIGGACARLYDATEDAEIRAMLASAALEVGVTHNRFYVMDVAARLIQGAVDDKTALALAHALLPLKAELQDIVDRINVPRLNPIVRELFVSDDPA